MTVSEYVVLIGGCGLGVILGWRNVYRVWRKGADLYHGFAFWLGESGRAGFHAFLLPSTVLITDAYAMILLDFLGWDFSGTDNVIAWLMLGLILVLIPASFWMWLFAWPRFLVPPAYRGQRGWIPELWHRLRNRRGKPGSRASAR